jgi:hypothetical protein
VADDGGRVFREAWIEGVRRHFPGDPKPGYVTPWDETSQWERDSAAAVYEQVRGFLEATRGRAGRLTREQKGQYIAVCWAAQIHRHFDDPKSSYVAGWDGLPQWQQETDADIFERIEKEPLRSG